MIQPFVTRLVSLLRFIMVIIPLWISAPVAMAQITDVQVMARSTLIMAGAITWPESAIVDRKNLRIGLLGSARFEQALRREAAARGLSLQIRVFKTIPDLRACDLLILDDNFKLEDIASDVLKNGMVTVGYSRNFARNGGIIGFIAKGTKTGFELNVSEAKKRGLTIDPVLFRLAERIY